MKLQLLIATLLQILAMPVMAQQENTIRRYEVRINDIDQLYVNNDITVDYHCRPDSAGYVIFYTTKEKAGYILFDDNGRGRLSVQSDVDCPQGESLPHVSVYSSSLTKVLNSGDSLVVVNDSITAPKFTAILIGNGRLSVHNVSASNIDASLRSGHGQLIISGNCTTAKLSLVGTGTIQADRLNAVNGKASVVGTGTIGCSFSESLTIMGMGSGNVFYRSKPDKIKNRGMGIKHGLLDDMSVKD